MTAEDKLKIREMFISLQQGDKDQQKQLASEMLRFWAEVSSEKHVRLILPYVASLLQSGRPPSSSVPVKALERAEYFERLIHNTPKDRDDYREYLLKLAADRLHIEVPSLERDIKMAKDYWRSLGCNVDGFCETSRKSD